jgi:glutamate--cysteine ligase
MICALPAFWTGILYDEENLNQIWEETEKWPHDSILALYKEVPSKALEAKLSKESIYEIGTRLLDISSNGLNKRGYLNSHGQDESIHLEKLKDIIKIKKTPADVLIDEFFRTKDMNSILNQRYY